MLVVGAWLVAVAAREAAPATGTRTGPPLAPRATGWEVATLGHRPAAASLLWMRTVVYFSTTPDPDPAWVESAVRAVAELDPTWADPSRYGALMLAVLGDVAGHESVLAEACARWPDDPWFPTALGMSRWLEAGDPAGAAQWLAFAAATPGADPLLARLAARAAAEAP